jgi:hypothetical protein
MTQPFKSSAASFDGIPATWKGKDDSIGTLRWSWPYRSRDGKEVLGLVARYDRSDGGKVCIPFFSREAEAWKKGAPPEPRPLYGLDTLDWSGPLFIVEGEKDATALHELGCAAVTSPGGSCAAAKADWSALSGEAQVILWPDADTPGAKYADDVMKILAKLPDPPKVIKRVVPDRLDLNDGEGAADWVQSRVLNYDGFGPIPREPGIDLLDELLEALAECAVAVELEKALPCDTSDIATLGGGPPVPLLPDDTPEDFPIDALGSLLGGAARAIHAAVQAPLAMCGNSVLAAASLATQGQADFELQGLGRRPVSDFFLTVGLTGERKSAVDRWTLRAVWKYQSKMRALAVEQEKAYKRELAAYRFLLKEKQRELRGADADTVAEALAALGDAPEGPVYPVLIISDFTLEGLQSTLKYGWPSVSVATDEGGTITGGHAMLPENLLKTLAGMSSLWDGKPLAIVRKGDGNTVLEGRRVSLHLMMQPCVATLLLDDAIAGGQGFLTRCLTVWPRSTAGTRLFKPIDLDNDICLRRYENRITELLETPLPLKGEDAKVGSPGRLRTGELIPMRSHIRGAALDVWCEFHDEIERQLPNEYDTVRGLAAKTAEHAARLAAILYVIEGEPAPGNDIPACFVRRGCVLARFYLHEAMRIKGMGRDIVERERADRLINWLRPWLAKEQRHTFTNRDLQRSGPNEMRHNPTARTEALKLLEEHGHIASVEGGRGKTWKLIPLAE